MSHLRRPLHFSPLTLALATAFCVPLAVAQDVASSLPTATNATPVRSGEKLSQWLLRHRRDANSDLGAILWLSTHELTSQQQLKDQLLTRLQASKVTPTLLQWLQQRPVTGRVALASGDALWLTAHPAQDPRLQAGDRVIIPARARNVSVLLESGQICQARHQPGALALEYLNSCLPDGLQRDTAWLVQPNGQQHQLHVAAWNATSQPLPQPGAWLWAPARNSKITARDSSLLARFLATQGPATDRAVRSPLGLNELPSTWTTNGLAPNLRAVTPTADDLPLSAGTWGEIGLLQTPSARMEAAGTLRTHISRSQPYTRVSVMFQPLDWLEGGFRYTDIADRAYDPTGSITSQSYKDKSFDLKVRLWPESRYIPQLALGVRDLGGTGLFSGEYLVGSKRSGNWDWSVGLGWGYVGARGDISNPLGYLSEKAKDRGQTDFGVGGETNFKQMFRGPVGVFGGVQWHTPYRPLTLKLELDGNNYKQEPAGSVRLEQKLPLNFGAVYRYSPTTDFSVGIERGDKVMLGVTFRARMAQMGAPKLRDPAAPAVQPWQPSTTAPAPAITDLQAPANPDPARSAVQPAATAPAQDHTARTIEQLTDWRVERITQQPGVWTVALDDNGTLYRQYRLERALAALHRAAPPHIQRFTFVFGPKGLKTHTHTVDRQHWVNQILTAQTPAQRQQADAQAQAANAAHATDSVLDGKNLFTQNKRLSGGLAPSFWQSFGGPDTFMLYQIGIKANAELRLTRNTWISGSANLRVLDNYDKFKYDAPSNLPRVRTSVREYVTESRLTLSNLQLSHVQQLSANQFGSVYAGYLETMYAGVGAEWLYRRPASNWAVSVDVNHVKQRDFDQKFGLRDYKVTTGHATLHWDTGWNGIHTKLSVGQYLAGDKGATLDVSRTFNNGVTMGVWATKTNVSAEQFGEGSFDKGLYLRFPFDAMLPRSSPGMGNFLWQPLLRDGGARLGRAVHLYDLTQTRDHRAWKFEPINPIPAMQRTGADLFSPDTP